MSLASYYAIKILNPSNHTFQPLSHQLPLNTPKHTPIPRLVRLLGGWCPIKGSAPVRSNRSI